jgi:hypothetical protein
MAMAWHDVYKDFYTPPKKEQLELFKAIKQDLFPEPKADISKQEKGVFRLLNLMWC